MSLCITNVPLFEDDAINAGFHLYFSMLLKTSASLTSNSRFAVSVPSFCCSVCTAKRCCDAQSAGFA